MKIIMLMFCLSMNIAKSNYADTIVAQNKIFKGVTDTTYDCKVVTSSRITYKDVKLFDLTDSTVMILNGEISEKLLISNIKTVKFKGRGFWKGARIGGGIGFVLGALAGAIGVHMGSDGSSEGSLGQSLAIGTVFAIPFALIGGGLGSLFAEDQFYDLSKLNFESKRKIIRTLMRENSDK